MFLSTYCSYKLHWRKGIFTSKKHYKNYMRSTISEERFNVTLLLNIENKLLNFLNLENINDFSLQKAKKKRYF